jgi:chromate transporter
MGAVAAGLVIATALKLLPTLARNPLGVPLALAFAASMFVAIALLHWPLVWTLGALGAVSCLVARSRL